MPTADDPCRSRPDDWFSESKHGTVPEKGPLAAVARRAVEGCLNCEKMLRCLRLARDNREPYGIWGGETSAERAAHLGLTLQELRGGDIEDQVPTYGKCAEEGCELAVSREDRLRCKRHQRQNGDAIAAQRADRIEAIVTLDRENPGMRTADIAEKVGVSDDIVRRVLRDAGMPRSRVLRDAGMPRSPGRVGKRPSMREAVLTSIDGEATAKDIAGVLGVSQDLVMGHLRWLVEEGRVERTGTSPRRYRRAA